MLKTVFCLFVIIMLFIPINASSDNKSQFSIISFLYDGRVIKITDSSIEPLLKIDFPFQSIIYGGRIFEDTFVLFENTYQIVRYDLKTGKKEILYDLKDRIEPKLSPDTIEFINRITLFFSAAERGDLPRLFKFSYFYVDLNNGSISRWGSDYCQSGYLSSNGGKIACTKNDGTICIYCEKGVQELDLNGRYPTISPDGSKIAYISKKNWIGKVYVYDLNTKKNKSIFSCFKGIDSKIRWSQNSRLLAIKSKSDIFSTSLYIIDVKKNKVIGKIKEGIEANWFFEERGNKGAAH
jgi:hypothetical protein